MTDAPSPAPQSDPRDRLVAATKRLERIRSAERSLAEAQERLKAINRYVKSPTRWEPELRIAKTPNWPYEITIKVPIPSGYLQQLAVDEVVRAERNLNKLLLAEITHD